MNLIIVWLIFQRSNNWCFLVGFIDLWFNWVIFFLLFYVNFILSPQSFIVSNWTWFRFLFICVIILRFILVGSFSFIFFGNSWCISSLILLLCLVRFLILCSSLFLWLIRYNLFLLFFLFLSLRFWAILSIRHWLRIHFTFTYLLIRCDLLALHLFFLLRLLFLELFLLLFCQFWLRFHDLNLWNIINLL